MDARRIAECYREYGFIPFPLSPKSKEPPAGSSLSRIEREYRFKENSNIGLFAGSENGLVIVDADNEDAKTFMTNKLQALGLWDWTTIVKTPKRGGLHFYLKVRDVPQGVQAYYKLPKNVGGGEFRVRRPAYVVAPGSVIPEGAYKFVQGSPKDFVHQPSLEWSSLTWLTKKVASYALEKELVVDPENSDLLALPYTPVKRNNPFILRLFKVMRETPDGQCIPKIHYKSGTVDPEGYSTRSECEAAIVTGLIRSGWSFDEIANRFEVEKPGHYCAVPNKWRYLVNTYNGAIRYLSRSKV